MALYQIIFFFIIIGFAVIGLISYIIKKTPNDNTNSLLEGKGGLNFQAFNLEDQLDLDEDYDVGKITLWPSIRFYSDLLSIVLRDIVNNSWNGVLPHLGMYECIKRLEWILSFIFHNTLLRKQFDDLYIVQ